MPTGSVDDAVTRAARIAFVFAALAVLSIAFRPASILLDKPLTEDGFYLLTVARHLAAGHGLSIDGVHPTNGIQPLFTFFAAPAYWLAGGDRIAALRGVLFVHGMFFVAAAWLFGLVLRDARSGTERLRWFGSLSWLGSGFLVLLSHNGLETGCLLFFYLAYLRLAQRRPLAGTRSAIEHGALLGVVVLTRIDATFFVVAACALTVLRGTGAASQRCRDAAVVGVVAAVVSSPWWIYNEVLFGALMPTSGTAQGETLDGTAGIVASRLGAAATNMLLVATPELYGGDGAGHAVFLTVRGAFAALVLFVIWRLPAVPPEERRSRGDGRLAALALLVAGAAFLVWYPWRSWATHFYNRYFVPLAPFGLALSTIAFERVAFRVRWFGPLFVAAVVAATFAVVAIVHTGAVFRGNQWLHDQVPLVRANVPEGARLAAGQSGTLGYFVDGVHNLDGKVNAEALRHQHDMHVYLAANDIEWLCDWPVYLHRYVGKERLAAEWRFVDRRGEFELWRRRR